MSYTIYKKVKQTNDQSFIVTSADSSIRDWNGKRCWDTYEIQYFKGKNLNKKQILVSFLLHSAWGGSVFYPKRYRELSKKALEYINKNNIEADKFDDVKIIDDCLSYLNLK